MHCADPGRPISGLSGTDLFSFGWAHLEEALGGLIVGTTIEAKSPEPPSAKTSKSLRDFKIFDPSGSMEVASGSAGGSTTQTQCGGRAEAVCARDAFSGFIFTVSIRPS